MSSNKRKERILTIIFIAQILHLSSIWVLVVGITIWLLKLLLLSIELKDNLGFSVVISLITIPVFWTLASLLTYVFVGLRRNRITD
ncbi:MAG TPA: hypothetical protein ENI07_07550 [Desulfobacterales bacterium]|nr:hypothetical protein [Desulfobacterales bacterium]